MMRSIFMSLNGDEFVTVCISMLRRDLNRLTHMMSDEKFDVALMSAACEQICNYRSRVDPHGDHPYAVRNPIDPG